MLNDGPSSYSLRGAEIPLGIRRSWHPWIQAFVGLDPATATTRLHDRWASVGRESLRELRETLSEFEVREIIDFGDGGLIKGVRPGASDESVGNCFYLPGPLDSDVLNSRLASVSLAGNPAIQEFMSHFAGLAEDTTVAGHFVYSESPWPVFEDRWRDSIDDEGEFEAWKGSLILFHARNGCHVLVHPTGRVAWLVMQEASINEIAGSFDDFLFRFNEHRKLAWPYDPYGP